ncbi:MAG: RidA family protein [Pseudohongiellaceae bacterium]|jgi:enamine deaminase RidA (YjgF/YER057c/UK114 family)
MKAIVVPLLVLVAQACIAAEVVRYANEGSTLPIAAAVEVDGVLYHSGVIPSAANAELDRRDRNYWGDTETQTFSVLGKIEASLAQKGLSMGDIVKLTVFLVGDPENGGRMDFQGFMRGYTRFFGEHSGGRLPARSVVEVAALVNPGMFVEIEAVAVRSD